MTTASGRTTKARIYETVRTAHLERSHHGVPSWLIYEGVYYDYDERIANNLPFLRKLSWPKTLRFALSADIDTIELNEPLALKLWPRFYVLTLTLLLRRILGRGKVTLVAYCIENYSPCEKLIEYSGGRLPRTVARYAVAIGLLAALLPFKKLAFGTEGSLETYKDALGPFSRTLASRVRLFPALPSPSESLGSIDPSLVVFLGALDNRKGITQILECWDEVEALVPSAKLLVMGKGEFAATVRDWVEKRPRTHFVLDPERSEIFRSLSRAKVLVLLSQPYRMWREQVGLPIVEGLAFGCEIVTTEQTGLATWLRDHGHSVIPSDSSASDRASALARALASNRTKADIQRSLPAEDSRMAADAWMLA